LPANDRRQDFLRARLVPGADGALRAQPFARQDSSMLSALAQSDCLIIRPANAAAITEGTAIPVLRLDRFGLGF
jgi:molybdopterin molybdotransferase